MGTVYFCTVCHSFIFWVLHFACVLGQLTAFFLDKGML
jgi:hypothetical protein